MKDYYKHIEHILRKLIEHYLYDKSLKYIIEKFILKFYKYIVEKKKI